MIAKIFEVNELQAIVMKTNEPAVDIHYEMDDMIVTTSLNFKDDDEGFIKRDRAFDTLDEEAITGIYASIIMEMVNEKN